MLLQDLRSLIDECLKGTDPEGRYAARTKPLHILFADWGPKYSARHYGEVHSVRLEKDAIVLIIEPNWETDKGRLSRTEWIDGQWVVVPPVQIEKEE